MDIEIIVSVVIIIVRLLLPLTILRWPLGGTIACIIADTFDHYALRAAGFGLFSGGHYQVLDKILDTWYLCFLLIVMLRWKNPLARRTGIVLFVVRFVGFAVFEISGWRPVFVIFPNVVEYFFLLWTIILKWFPRFRLTRRRLAIILVLVTIPKLYQELMMHVVYVDQKFSLLNHFQSFGTWIQRQF